MTNPPQRVYERISEIQTRVAESSDHSMASLYHEQSKRWPRGLSIPFASYLDDLLPDLSRSAFKEYRSARRFQLLDTQELPVSLNDLILKRRTIRAFTSQAVRLEQISTLLALSYRIIHPRVLETPSKQIPKRPVPSGGPFYPLELYLTILSADQPEAGLYHYHPALHALELLSSGAQESCLEFGLIPSSLPAGTALVFCICGVLPRNHFRYGELGYRLMMLEAGHLAQNVLLVAEAIGLGGLPCCGFYDDRMHDYLGVDGVDEMCLYMLMLGHPDRRVERVNDNNEGSF